VNPCPNPEILLQAAEDRLAPDLAATWQAHLEGCPECQRNLAELRTLGSMLAELGRAAEREPTRPVWAHVAARLERPGLLDRLPLGFAGALRHAQAFLQPTVAGGVVATLGGLILGTWLALTFNQAPATSLAIEPYATSSLVDDNGAALSDSYFAIGAESSSEPDAAIPGAGAADSGGATP
jgi:hypothetical protein